MSKQPTQKQLYYRAVANAAEADRTFLFMVEQGMTREELIALIKRRPALWSRFANWLDKLPHKE